MDKSFELREAMINGQILPNKVTDVRVTAALMAVPREPFLPKALRGVAYLDEDIPIAEGRCLMEPAVFARLLQAAAIKATDVVLDIGCASGYSSAVLAHLASAVVAVEADEALVALANENLAALAIDNVAVVIGSLTAGYPDEGPYDVVFLNGMVEQIPDAIKFQLTEGGRMVVVERRDGVGKAYCYTNLSKLVACSELFDAQIPPLSGFETTPRFVF